MSFQLGFYSFGGVKTPYVITTFHQPQQPTVVAGGGDAVIIVPSAPHESDLGRCLTDSCKRSQRTLTCYTPNNADGVVSCSIVRGSDIFAFMTDDKIASVPAGSIIDSIEFFGMDGFSTKDVFSIGLGALNQRITFPLIEDADMTTANDYSGGCREFRANNANGKNEKNVVTFNSNVNVDLSQPISSGCLQIVIRYHMKIT